MTKHPPIKPNKTNKIIIRVSRPPLIYGEINPINHQINEIINIIQIWEPIPANEQINIGNFGGLNIYPLSNFHPYQLPP